MTKWFISDTHFAHENILKFEAEKRPFKSIEEHDEYLINGWNALIKPDDTLIHLGDVCFKSATKIDEIMPQLNGRKLLVRGNHDTQNAKKYLEYFDDVLSVIEDKKRGIIYSHYPLHPQCLTHRYKFNVHGHTHSHIITESLSPPFGHCGVKPDRRYMNICVEHTALGPVHEDYIYSELRIKK